ncbi:hypothetical protein K0M31_009365 [Melipona bicolor]|uniref:Uncharacterized protein n=1 Tax=Melipona bicolor TaxID=60889 RepID=A0AA40FMX1_9HYME|nr:hypothetical protein K0M31_009365 [Melipona bicolor]
MEPTSPIIEVPKTAHHTFCLSVTQKAAPSIPTSETGTMSIYISTKSLHPENAISGSGIRAVCRSVIRNYLGPWNVARVRFWVVCSKTSPFLCLSPDFFQEHRAPAVQPRVEEGRWSEKPAFCASHASLRD